MEKMGEIACEIAKWILRLCAMWIGLPDTRDDAISTRDGIARDGKRAESAVGSVR